MHLLLLDLLELYGLAIDKDTLEGSALFLLLPRPFQAAVA
jgi:hypothetical protein